MNDDLHCSRMQCGVDAASVEYFICPKLFKFGQTYHHRNAWVQFLLLLEALQGSPSSQAVAPGSILDGGDAVRNEFLIGKPHSALYLFIRKWRYQPGHI